MAHRYRVEGQNPTISSEWQVIHETDDPVEAVDCAHYVEGWFWRRLYEDDQLVFEM